MELMTSTTLMCGQMKTPHAILQFMHQQQFFINADWLTGPHVLQS
jgi:hypothetical protein